jgi:16S rRNA G1207 methylase RsmC
LKIERYPPTNSTSLQAWNSADELLVQQADNHVTKQMQLAIYHDTFGYLSCHLHSFNPQVVTVSKSQEKAIIRNLQLNKQPVDGLSIINPLGDLEKKTDVVFMKMPKSNDLFELFLNHIINNLDEDGTVYVGFMTRNFSSGALAMAKKYFDSVEQTKAIKKARLMILRKPVGGKKESLIHKIEYQDLVFQQYYGVFSANNIDYATQYLIENLKVTESDLNILDLGCGNGVIGIMAHKINPEAQVHYIDDQNIAIESARLNSKDGTFYHQDNLDSFADNEFHLVLSNPPFHFEHENNIEISLNLFREVHRILKKNGSFQMVANQHLNYKPHLQKIFKSVHSVNNHAKYIIYRCLK